MSSQIKRQNRGSLLGYMWWFLDPLLMTAIYFLIIVVLFKRTSDNQPYVLFLICGLFCFKAFSDTVGQSVNTMRMRASIIKAIGFPKAVLPLAGVLANTIYFGFGMVVIMAIALIYGPSHNTWPTLAYFYLPIVIAVQIAFTMGVALALSVIGVFYSDVANIVRHLMRVWFYLSPGLYATTLIPEKYRDLYMLNPFVGMMDSYRAIIMQGDPPVASLWTSAAIAFVSLLGGAFLFRHFEGRIVQKL